MLFSEVHSTIDNVDGKPIRNSGLRTTSAYPFEVHARMYVTTSTTIHQHPLLAPAVLSIRPSSIRCTSDGLLTIISTLRAYRTYSNRPPRKESIKCMKAKENLKYNAGRAMQCA